MERMEKVEKALAWAYGHTYCFAGEAMDEYVCQFKDLEWYTNYQNLICFKKRGIIGSRENSWLTAREGIY